MIGSAIALGLASAAVAVPDDYSIADVRFDISDNAVLGPLRAGLLCLPAGKVRWKDLTRPDASTVIPDLHRKLAADSLRVEAGGDPIFAVPAPPTRYRLRVTVVNATLKLCKPGSPIGPQIYKGTGSLTIVWETFDRQARETVLRNEFVVPLVIENGGARSDASPTLAALKRSAGLYAATRR